MAKFVKYLSYALLAITAVLGVLFYATSNTEGMTEIMLYYCYILFFAAIALALILPLINLLNNPKGFKKIMTNLGAIIVVFGLSYILASGDALQVAVNPAPSEFTLKLTDAGLIATYILSVISIVAIVLGGIMNLVKNR